MCYKKRFLNNNRCPLPLFFSVSLLTLFTLPFHFSRLPSSSSHLFIFSIHLTRPCNISATALTLPRWIFLSLAQSNLLKPQSSKPSEIKSFRSGHQSHIYLHFNELNGHLVISQFVQYPKFTTFTPNSCHLPGPNILSITLIIKAIKKNKQWLNLEWIATLGSICSQSVFLIFSCLSAPASFVALFDISIWPIDCRYIDTFEKYRYR